ncbi:uncharacterized protein LOC144588290 [Pogona vitticeps]
MPLTRSQMVEVSEQRDQAMSDWSGDESNGEGRVASVQEEANGRQLSELRKIQLAQAHEFQMKQLEKEERIERERIALEKEKMEREAERERIALEKEKMAFEIRRMELLNQNNNNNRENEESQLSKSDLKKFPTYKQGDCPENFLKIFERSCDDFSVRETEKMIILRSLLSGKMADVYADMPVELSKDYSEFKKMVFNRFGINSEHLRQKFRKLTKRSDESYTQLGFNLEKCLDRWLEQENVKTFQELKNVVGLEQFYSLLHGELKFLVQERKPTDVRNAAQIADFISQIRGPSCYEGRGVRKTWDPKFSKEQAQRQTKVGGHFSEKPSEQGQHSKQVLEGKEKLERFDGKSSWGERICFICKKKGHIAAQCFNTRQNKEIPPQKVNVKEAKAVFCVQSKPQASSIESSVTMETQAEAVRSSELDTLKELPLAEVVHCYYIETNCALLESAGDRIKVFENDYTALRDTCSQISICHSDIVPQSCMIADQTLSVKGIGSELVSLPVAGLKIEYQGWKGFWRVGVSSEIPTPFLIGNDLTKHVKSALVVTRAQSVQSEASNETDSQGPEKFVPQPEAFSVEIPQKSLFVKEQTADPTLKDCFGKVTGKDLSPECPERFIIKGGLLYKEKLNNISKGGPEVKRQLVVPEKYRPMILEKGHADIFSAHMGINKTKQRIAQNFYWPDMGKHIKSFCQRCHICQRQGSNCDKTRAKLYPLPVISTPFTRLGVDIIGPMPNATKRGNRFILTIVDHATRYLEAIPLRNIETQTVAEALVNYMSRMGFPSEIITDLGTSFTSRLMKRLWQICGIKHLETSPYHPESNGLTERFNGTLIRMIRAYLQENPNNWDQKLQLLLYAYRSVPQESTGFSPFELLFGRQVRGPLDLIKQNWEQCFEDDPQNVVAYIDSLMNCLKRNMDLAVENLTTKKAKQKQWYDRKARERQFNPGDDVLRLKPIKGNKLQLKWDGPYRVVEKMSDLNYIIEDEEGSGRRVVHINALKPYYRETNHVLFAMKAAGKEEPELPFWEGRGQQKYNPQDVQISPTLSTEQHNSLLALVTRYREVFSSKPGVAKGVLHKIDTGNASPQSVTPYRVTGPYVEKVRKELDEMLKDQIIVPSSSAWSAPIVLVYKPDGSVRFCVDYRKLNAVTKPDAYPMPRLDDFIETIGGV